MLRFAPVLTPLSVYQERAYELSRSCCYQRHHDIIPWDDDLDIAVNVNYRGTIQDAIVRVTPQFDLTKFANYDIVNLWANHSGNHTVYKEVSYPWSWPFLDIWYFRATVGGTGQDISCDSCRFNLNGLFPLTYKPFGRYWHPAPRRPVDFLSTYYSSNPRNCKSSRWSHATERQKKAEERPCDQVLEKHAFVQRCSRGFIGNNSWSLAGHWYSNKAPVYVNEHLVGGDRRSIHDVRTILSLGESLSAAYTARPQTFSCDRT